MALRRNDSEEGVVLIFCSWTKSSRVALFALSASTLHQVLADNYPHVKIVNWKKCAKQFVIDHEIFERYFNFLKPKNQNLQINIFTEVLILY